MDESFTKQQSVSILYDAALCEPPAPEWFQPEWWRQRGLVTDRLGGRGQALGVVSPAGHAVLRRFHRGGLIARVSADRFLGLNAARSRAFREFRLLARLRALALPVPEPLAASFEPVGPCYRAALLTRRIPEARELAVLASTLERSGWQQLNETLARFFAAGLCHPDLNARNIVLGGSGQWYLLDFDRARLATGAVSGHAMRRRLARSLARLVPPGWEVDFDATVGARRRSAGG